VEIFVYNAARPREELASFNHRIEAFCRENMVIQARASMVGPSLMVALTLAEDMDLPIANTITATVRPVDGLADDLEDALTKALEGIAAEDTEGSPHIAYTVDTVFRTDFPVQGFALFHIVTGSVVSDDEGAEEEE